MIPVLAWVNVLIVFCVELAALAAFAIFGAHAVSSSPWRWLMAVALALAAAIVWGMFCAPRAVVPLPPVAVTGIKLAMLSAATAALAATGHPRWAIIFAVVALTTGALAQLLPNPTTA